jgi:hypothetical protein
MVFAARVAEVVIASSDDTDRFRPAIGQALNWWNAASGQRHEIVFMPSGGQHRTAGAERLTPPRNLPRSWTGATCSSPSSTRRGAMSFT